MAVTWIGSIGSLLVNSLFGSVLVAAVVLFGVLVVWGISMRFTMDCWIANIPALMYVLFFHPETAILPVWIWQILALVMGVIIGLAVIRIYGRR